MCCANIPLLILAPLGTLILVAAPVLTANKQIALNFPELVSSAKDRISCSPAWQPLACLTLVGGTHRNAGMQMLGCGESRHDRIAPPPHTHRSKRRGCVSAKRVWCCDWSRTSSPLCSSSTRWSSGPPGWRALSTPFWSPTRVETSLPVPHDSSC